jgi:hypothetical protein
MPSPRHRELRALHDPMMRATETNAVRSPEDAIDGVVAVAVALERCEARPEPVRVLGWL